MVQQPAPPAQEEKQEAAPAAAAPAAASAKEVHVPDIGGDEVEVTEIMVKVGDTIAAEQSLIAVKAIKPLWKCRRRCTSTVKEMIFNTGDKVSTGSLIMIFEVAGAAPAAAPAKAEAAPAAVCTGSFRF
ncbi:biotin/lipoyl-containing protein [Escherichia coli]